MPSGLRSAIPARNSASSKHCRARASVSSDQCWKQGPGCAAVTDNRLKPAKPALTLPDKPSIAILPFTNLSSDPDQDYFADGMVDEITTALSRFNFLFVIARNSSFTYKGKSVDIKQVGRELGVR
jgi:TolB-like protein